MDIIDALSLRGRIDEKRKEFPFLPAYLGPYGLRKAIDRYLPRQKDDRLADFGKELDHYLAFGRDFVAEQAKIHDPLECRFVTAFCFDAFSDMEFEGVDALLTDFNAYVNGCAEGDFLPMQELALYRTLMTGIMRTDYPWRGKPIAAKIEALLPELDVSDDYYLSLSRFYAMVLRYEDAARVALDGANRFAKLGHLPIAAHLAKTGYGYAAMLPEYPFPPEEELNQVYGQRAKSVLGYRDQHVIKHDPIESTPEFQEAYDEVMEEAMERYHQDEQRIVFNLWTYMEEGFAQRGIAWKNPQKMNPSMRFD